MVVRTPETDKWIASALNWSVDRVNRTNTAHIRRVYSQRYEIPLDEALCEALYETFREDGSSISSSSNTTNDEDVPMVPTQRQPQPPLSPVQPPAAAFKSSPPVVVAAATTTTTTTKEILQKVENLVEAIDQGERNLERLREELIKYKDHIDDSIKCLQIKFKEDCQNREIIRCTPGMSRLMDPDFKTRWNQIDLRRTHLILKMKDILQKI